MGKSLLIALTLIALGASMFFSYSALDASRSHDAEIAALQEELAVLRQAREEEPATDSKRVVIADPLDTDEANAQPMYSMASDPEFTGEVAGETDPFIEAIAGNEERLTRLATLVRAQLDEAPVESKNAVRETLADIKAEEEETRRNRRLEMVYERTREQVKGYRERLDLYPAEEEEMTQILVDLSERRFDFFRRAREGEEAWSGIREKMQEMTGESDAELKEVLSEDQFAEYEVIRQEERAAQGWGGWGRQRNNRDKDAENTDSNQ